MSQTEVFNLKFKFILLFIIFFLTSAISDSYWGKTAISGRKVCLFFDDGWKNHYDHVLPILKELGFKASFGIITDHIGADRGSSRGRMNISELKELERYGMEIASHTKTHPHMLNLTHEQRYSEIIGSKTGLMQLGFTVNTFIYPYGEWNSTVTEYVKEADYLCARTVTCEPYSLDAIDPDTKYHISSWPITNQTFDEFKEILTHSTENEVVVLTYHIISDEGPKSKYTTLTNFYHQMKYLKENNFEIILISEIFQENEKKIWKQPYFAPAIITLGFATILLSFYLYFLYPRAGRRSL